VVAPKGRRCVRLTRTSAKLATRESCPTTKGLLYSEFEMTLFCAFKSLGNGAIAGSLETRLRAKLPNWTLFIGSSLPAVVFLRAMWQFGVLSVSLRSTWSTSTDPIKAVLLGLTIRVLCLARRYDVDDVIAAAWNGMLSTNLGRQKRSPARAPLLNNGRKLV
jgi:hypothetical protein